MSRQFDPVSPNLDEYRPMLSLLARMQIGPRYQSKLDSSDIVQQTLLDAHQQWGQFRGTTEAELAAWLRQMLACNLADGFRAFGRAKRDVALERSLEAEMDESCSRLDGWLEALQTSPSARAVRNEQLLRLAQALEELPEPQRLAVEWHHLQGLTLAEVAWALDRSSASVAGLLRRGLKRLRELLAETEEAGHAG